MPMNCQCDYRDNVVVSLCGAHSNYVHKIRADWKDGLKAHLDHLDRQAMDNLRNGKHSRAAGMAEAAKFISERYGI